MSITNVTLNPYGGYVVYLSNGLQVSVATNDFNYIRKNEFQVLTHVELSCFKTDTNINLSSSVWPSYCQNDDVIGFLPIDKIDTLVQLANDWKE